MIYKLRHFLPNAVTLGSLALGIASIMLLHGECFVMAASFIAIATILDVIDGQLAMRFNAITEVGKQLDSLADMVTFGVAPTMFVYHLMLRMDTAPPVAVASSLTFALAGAYRLARFNTLPSDRSAYFSGMPIPLGSLLLIAGWFWQHWTLNTWWVFFVVGVSYLMICPFSYPKLKHLTQLPALAWGILFLFGLSNWLLLGWQMIPFNLSLLYAIGGPLFVYVSQMRRPIEVIAQMEKNS